MILTAHEIMRQMDLGRIEIAPFNADHLNPNSYDVTLSPVIRRYILGTQIFMDPDCPPLSVARNESTVFLHPGVLYLASTVERTKTPYHVPILEGKSSLARLGIQIHATAGFGDLGFDGTWTLEITVVYPTILRAGMRIGQIAFVEPVGEIDRLYAGKYQHQSGPTPSIAYAKE